MNAIIEVDDYSICFMCGAKLKSDDWNKYNWENVYECGCVIGGALEDEIVYCYTECNKKVKE